MDEDRDVGVVLPCHCGHITGGCRTGAGINDHPTLEQQRVQQPKRPPQTPRDVMKTTRERINALPAV
jgi:hypothetical protein